MLLDDKIFSEKLGAKGREMAKERFSLSSMAEKVIKLYTEVISEKEL